MVKVTLFEPAEWLFVLLVEVAKLAENEGLEANLRETCFRFSFSTANKSMIA